jgi:hypothetical protein
VTDLNQDFKIYAACDLVQAFSLFSDASNSVALDVSGASEIEWILYDKFDAAKLTKKKSTAGITFVSSGVDGKIQIIITHADSATLVRGWYSHRIRVTDGIGNVTLVETGRALLVDDTKGG